MSTESLQNRLQLVQASQEKYTHFLLGVAGAAIAFSVQQTSGLSIHWSQMPLGCATGLWGYSFFCGCRRIDAETRANIASIASTAAYVTNAESLNQSVFDEVDLEAKKMNSAARHANYYLRKQFDCLVAGGVMFIAWHVGEMILTPAH